MAQSDVLIEYVKEKDNLRAALKEKEKELQQYKAKVYDLTEANGALKKEIKKIQKEASKQQTANNSKSEVGLTPNRLDVSRPSTSTGRSPSVKRAKSAKQRRKTNGKPQKYPDSPMDIKKYRKARDTLEHLHDVAEKYPELKLSVIFEAEGIFYESDTNNDGTIDESELEKLLLKQGHLYTNKQLKDIMSQIDVDNNSSIDIMEYLAVMEKVQQRKKLNLPQALTKSMACTIQ